MAVKDYNQYFNPNLSAYSGKFTYAVDWGNTWKFRNGLSNQVKINIGSNFSDLNDVKEFAKLFLTQTSVGQNPGPSASDIDSMSERDIYAVLGAAIYGSNVKSGLIAGGDVRQPNSEAKAALDSAIKHFKEYKNTVTALEKRGATPAQIQNFLQSDKTKTLSSEDWSKLSANIPTMSDSDLSSYGVTADKDADGNPIGIQLTPAAEAIGNAATPTETVNEQITKAVVGDSSLDALRKEEDFREENGRYFVGDQEYAYDEDNDQVVFVGGDKAGDRWTPEGSGMADQYDTLTEQEQQAIAQQQGIVDQLVGTDEVDPVTGEKVTPGLVNEYGDFVDKTLTAIDAKENDFAGQINAELNQFLTGKDAEGNVVGKGFLDYQTDLETAGTTLETGLTELQGLYNQAYKDYENELDPLRGEIGRIRGRLGDVADQQMDVARDAGDESYYSRLSDLYYQDAKDQLDASAAGARETLNEAYANAGLDPSSPAFTAAMKDLAMSRAGAERQAQRQSILDSYGLGSQMLTNRTTALSGAGNALGNEMAGVQTEMGALDSLYGVKLQGLNQRQDMIGQIYNTKANNANVGMQGLNTVLNTNLKGIDANQNQFNTKISLTNDLFKNKAGMYGTAYDTIGGMRGIYDKEGGDRLNTLTEYKSGKDSNKLLLETIRQYQIENPTYQPDEDFLQWLSK
jgi:hypothetical protein